MELNFGQMTQRLLSKIGGQAAYDAELVAKVKAIVNGSAAGVGVTGFYDWLVQDVEAGITATTVNITLPANCRNVFFVTLAGQTAPLGYKRFEREEIDGGVLAQIGRGTPSHWTTVGNYLWLLPYPAGADTARIWYYAYHTEMVLDADEPLVPGDHREYLLADSMWELVSADSFDKTMAQMLYRKKTDLYRALRSTGTKAAPVGYHMPVLRTGIWGGGQSR